MATQVLRTLDPRDEARVKRIQGMCHELHIMPPPVAHIGLEVYQCPKELLVAGHIPDGLKLDQIGVEPATVYNARSQSWVRNAYNIVVTQMLGLDSQEGAGYGAGKLANTDTGGTVRGNSSPYTLQVRTAGAWVGAVGSAAQGIVVGTGTGAESFEGYALGTIIAHGTGAGQLSYAAQETTTGAYTAGTKTWASTLIRYINNNSGGAIVVGEVACYPSVAYGTSSAYMMLCRDLQDPTVSVADTAQLKVTYTITSMAYPA